MKRKFNPCMAVESFLTGIPVYALLYGTEVVSIFASKRSIEEYVKMLQEIGEGSNQYKVLEYRLNTLEDSVLHLYYPGIGWK